MKVYYCRCGARVYFDNSECLSCGESLGFSARLQKGGAVADLAAELGYELKYCDRKSAGCNWLVDKSTSLCLSCGLVAQPRPPESELLFEMEKAQRRFVYSWLTLGLPLVSKQFHELGLQFIFDESSEENPVTIGHASGTITLDLGEANAAEREANRVSLGEAYRTLLGHFRHESGHYLWELLFRDGAQVEDFRAIFGDETASYQEALKKHYESPRLDYEAEFVSSYATMHPWEDWAETWAHYLHILDSWEIARAFGIDVHDPVGARAADPFERKLNEWAELMLALNSLNRSLGHADPYPFSIPDKVRQKLQFIHSKLRTELPRMHGLFRVDPTTDNEAERAAAVPAE